MYGTAETRSLAGSLADVAMYLTPFSAQNWVCCYACFGRPCSTLFAINKCVYSYRPALHWQILAQASGLGIPPTQVDAVHYQHSITGFLDIELSATVLLVRLLVAKFKSELSNVLLLATCYLRRWQCSYSVAAQA